jgi:hypothetical protein
MNLSHSATEFKPPSPPFHNSDHHHHLDLWMHQMANMILSLFRPMKKKGGVTPAGIARASGERNSPTGNGAFSNNQVSFHHICNLPSRWIIFCFISTPFTMIWDQIKCLGHQIIHFTSCYGRQKCKRPDGNLCIPPLPSRTSTIIQNTPSSS